MQINNSSVFHEWRKTCTEFYGFLLIFYWKRRNKIKTMPGPSLFWHWNRKSWFPTMRFTSENITLARRRKNDSSCFIPFPVVGGEKKSRNFYFSGPYRTRHERQHWTGFSWSQTDTQKNHHMCVDIDSRLFYSNEQITGWITDDTNQSCGERESRLDGPLRSQQVLQP